MERRQFLKTSTAMGSALALGLENSFSKTKSPIADTSFHYGAARSRVVIAHSKFVRRADRTISIVQLARLLDTAIEKLFNKPANRAWSALFSARDIVGLKVNCLAGKNLSTHPEIVDHVIECLRSAGVKKQNIFIFDRRQRDLLRAGYKISRARDQIQCLGNDQVGFSEQLFEYGSVASQLSNILLHCTAVINLPILKDHGIVGLSCAMKNLFGVINNPNKYHMDIGDPFVADVNMLPPIRDKIRLTICDALTAQYEGGPPFMPEWSWPMNSLLAATDMVAMDRIAWDIIEEKRAEKGKQSLENAGRKPTYIDTAADSEHGLGTSDPDKIEVIRV